MRWRRGAGRERAIRALVRAYHAEGPFDEGVFRSPLGRVAAPWYHPVPGNHGGPLTVPRDAPRTAVARAHPRIVGHDVVVGPTRFAVRDDRVVVVGAPPGEPPTITLRSAYPRPASCPHPPGADVTTGDSGGMHRLKRDRKTVRNP